MRLTERVVDENGIEHIMTKYVLNNQKLKDEKLCQLEDIEEELGVDLLILFKVLKNGIYVKNKRGISFHQNVHIHQWYLTELRLYYRPYSQIRFCDYGKTWSINREDLL